MANPISRRNFISLAAVTGAVVTLSRSGLAQASETNREFGRLLMASAAGDVDVLNYALTLEHLEAELYRVLIAANFLSGKEAQYVRDFGAAEAAHVDAITAVIKQLGGTPVAKAAKYNFTAPKNRGDVLNTLATVEEVGAGAYLGAADKIESKDVLTAAGGIAQVEARHAAVIRSIAGMDPVPSPLVTAIPMERVLEIVKPFFG